VSATQILAWLMPHLPGCCNGAAGYRPYSYNTFWIGSLPVKFPTTMNDAAAACPQRVPYSLTAKAAAKQMKREGAQQAAVKHRVSQAHQIRAQTVSCCKLLTKTLCSSSSSITAQVPLAHICRSLHLHHLMQQCARCVAH